MPRLAAKSLSNRGVSALARQVEEVAAIRVARTVVVVDIVRIHVAGVDVGRGASLRRMTRALRERVVAGHGEPADQASLHAQQESVVLLRAERRVLVGRTQILPVRRNPPSSTARR